MKQTIKTRKHKLADCLLSADDAAPAVQQQEGEQKRNPYCMCVITMQINLMLPLFSCPDYQSLTLSSLHTTCHADTVLLWENLMVLLYLLKLMEAVDVTESSLCVH
jgi:hypothetical protein